MNQTTSEKHVAAHARQRKKGLTIFAAALLIAGAGSAYWYLNFGTGSESTDDAYVNGNLVQLTPEIAGTVTRIAADDGDYVTQGQEL
ncbi:MAG: biotin/lipoyl-binding protein, partial [Gammaproteobacteria bacterium]|nr:biotin/lipoyl-binding protein [Gammaproteobacteria bacterium]